MNSVTGKEHHMTRQDIEQAIITAKRWKAGFSLDDSQARDNLIQVGESWMKLEDYVNSPEHVGTWESLCVDEKMKELLNPTPKTDLERVREWAESKRPFLATYDELLTFIDQLEKEKENV